MGALTGQLSPERIFLLAWLAMNEPRPLPMTEEELQSFVDSNEWRFAKTMPHMPHWYCLRRKCPDEAEFERFINHIYLVGYDESFKGRKYRYINIGNHKYWTMNEPAHITILINRTNL